MANYAVEFTPRAKRELEKLPKLIQQRLRPRIDALAENPRPPGAKALVGVTNLYRIRVGDYRVVYTIRDQVPSRPGPANRSPPGYLRQPLKPLIRLP